MVKGTLNSRLYILIVIGIVSALGPFVTDFYLPALPVLTGYFDTTASLVQLSLTFSMVGLAVGQLVIGPLSDKYGRKNPLIVSLVLFCVSTLGCLYAPGIYVFIFFRLLQGLSGAGGVVISKSIATDLYEGKELARFFSKLSSVQGIAPVCAPVLGGVLLEMTDWKGIFWILVLIGILLIAALVFFKESLEDGQRQRCGMFSTFRYYIPVFRNTRFMRYVLVQVFAMGVMFTYIAASPFIFQEHFNISPLMYSICFGANAVAIMLGSLAVSWFHDAAGALRIGSIGFGIMSLFVTAALIFGTSVWLAELSLFIFMLFLGIILPSSTTLALDLERKNSGNASALLGFLMFLFGGILSPLTGLGNMLYTTSIIIVTCCIGTWYCNHIAVSPDKLLTDN
ncbi:multidrug effflux MFS transporter [uncultured Parabacteroides sp.]|uniref:multidrug effflux MFS transporter n=1 Tax=uncultured Parabacteroides sp. TaxID=512312 RepID=UPI00262B5ABA|nr:multidrug effflux MFS transporter [uncultured Parabacteroides sp.]